MTLYICRFWNKSDSLENVNTWLTNKKLKGQFTNDSDCDCNIIMDNFNEGYGKIEVRSGNLKCKFELKTFRYMYKEEKGTFV